MHRLNAFAQFESKPETYEDTLTRAFLVVLRLVPKAHERFLKLVVDNRKSASGLPNFSMIDSNTLVFATQTGRLSPADRLLSILLTDSDPGETIPVAGHPRKAVYDGVIAYAKEWVFIIENKPHHEDVWKGQLSPAKKDVQHTKVEGTAVILEWKAVFRELAKLVASGVLEYAANGLIVDFLDFVYEKFHFLNPYEKLASCKQNKELLNNRCRLAMEEIRPGHVGKRPVWGYYMRFDDGASQDVKLDAEGAGSDLRLLLSLHPGDTQNKAKLLYSALDVKRLSPLQKNGWQVVPNFHLAFMREGLFRSKGTIALLDYIAFWQKNQERIHQMPVGPESEVRECFKKYVALLAKLRIVSENEIPRILELTSKHKTINICPGLSLSYRWELCNAVDLDRRDKFVGDVRDRLQEAFDAWGQEI